MSASPLTHHDILGLVAPFARRGRHVDLGATDRIARRIVFRSVDHAAAAPLPAARETLELEHPSAGVFRLARVLELDGGLRARLETEGAEPGELLARIEAVPLQRQVAAGPGFVVARSYRLEVSGRRAAGPREARATLTQAAARVAGLEVALRVPRVGGMAADVELDAADGGSFAFTEDLLAVQGWEWARIERRGEGWRGTLRLPRREPARTREAEARLERTVAHLRHTLAEPPARFHERFLRARWAVALRRATPLLVCIALFAAAFALRDIELPERSVIRMLIFHVPPLLLALFFTLPEVARIEIPPVPRRPRDATWREGAAIRGTPGERCPATR